MPDDARGVLREIWAATGQRADDTDPECAAGGHARACKHLAGVGFDAMAGPDGDLRAAWRERLAREGKLGQGSVRDLVLGTSEH